MNVHPDEREAIGHGVGGGPIGTGVAHAELATHGLQALVDATAGFVHDGDATALQCRQRHRRTGGAHPGTATPLHLTAVRVGAEQCNSRAGGQRQQIAVVLQQHRAGDRCALDDVARGIAVVGELVGRHLAHARPVEEVQQPANRFVR